MKHSAMAVFASPRRSLSDSLDYDDELAELMAHSKEKSFRMSDEDTEDASEDGNGGDREMLPPMDERSRDKSTAVTEIKEQVYYDKLGMLKEYLAQLKDGVHPDYVRAVEKMTTSYNVRVALNKIWEQIERERIEQDFMKEKKAALREFEDKKIELKENLLNEFRERRKQIEVERTSLDVNSDNTEIKAVSTRKLRRRPNEPPAPAPEKRRKAPQSQISFLLDETDAEEDFLSIFNAKTVSIPKIPQEGNYGPSHSRSKSPSPVPLADVRIEDGKLFFEKRWFHRGQQIYLEGKETPLTSAVISGISQDTVWVRKAGDNAKIRVTLAQLIKGRYSVKRRA